MLKITTEMFEKSYFSIGGGLDIEPFKRFTHVTDTFINMNLYLHWEDVSQWYDKAFIENEHIHILYKKIHRDFSEETFFELEPHYNDYVRDLSFMETKDRINFQYLFNGVSKKEQYLIHYEIYRTDLNRNCSYFFCACEGITAYLALSRNGVFAPKILSTIVTGVLEHPDSFINTFFEKRLQKLPELWVRGFEPNTWDDWYSNVFTLKGVYKHKALDFNLTWKCGKSYPNMQTELRYCKGFVTSEVAERLERAEFKPEYRLGQHRLVTRKFELSSDWLKDGDYVILNTPFDLKKVLAFNQSLFFFQQENDIEIKHSDWWRLFSLDPKRREYLDYKYRSAHLKRLRVEEQILALKNFLEIANAPKTATVHIIPNCMEDEGEVYVKSLQMLDYATITYIPGLYDFIDLKDIPV